MLGVSGRRRDLERRLVMIMRANVPGRLSARVLVGIGLLGLIVLPAWTLGQSDTKDNKAVPAERDKQLQELEHKLQDVLKEVEAQRKPAPSAKPEFAKSSQGEPRFEVSVANSGSVQLADRDKKLQELEAKVNALLKEVQALQTKKSTTTASTMLQFSGSIGTAPGVPAEVTLKRTTYKLSAEKAEALGKFLQQHVKGVVMEIKVEGENLIVTTTPEVQQVIHQFIALTGGKTPPPPRWQRQTK
jgi:hypothetical protein